MMVVLLTCSFLNFCQCFSWWWVRIQGFGGVIYELYIQFVFCSTKLLVASEVVQAQTYQELSFWLCKYIELLWCGFRSHFQWEKESSCPKLELREVRMVNPFKIYFFSQFRNLIWFSFLSFALKLFVILVTWFEYVNLLSIETPKHLTTSATLIINSGTGPTNFFREINITSVFPIAVCMEKPFLPAHLFNWFKIIWTSTKASSYVFLIQQWRCIISKHIRFPVLYSSEGH